MEESPDIHGAPAAKLGKRRLSGDGTEGHKKGFALNLNPINPSGDKSDNSVIDDDKSKSNSLKTSEYDSSSQGSYK